MHILNFEENFLKDIGAFHTASEINSQPGLWLKVYKKLAEEKNTIQKFVDQALAETDKIILTGAGTSAYIGLSLTGIYSRKLGRTAMAIATTDLVTHPKNYYFSNETILLISFARSGNSPESTAAVELADRCCKKVFHLIITCDSEGNLAMLNSPNPRHVHVLPAESNDQSLAMTGSYSGMLLTALLLSELSKISKNDTTVDKLHRYGIDIIDNYSKILKDIAGLPFNRAVFLGSGPFFGTATESSLKLQELTDGQVICKNDTFLGLRHGPKAVIDGSTLLFFIFSGNPYVLQYEKDLVQSTRKGNRPLVTVGLSENIIDGCSFDHYISYGKKNSSTDDEFLTVPNILPGQLLGFYKSLTIGLKPDNPSVTGAISRVVEDVKIYSY